MMDSVIPVQSKRQRRLTWLLLLSPILIVAVMLASLMIGVQQISLQTVFEALFHFDKENLSHTIVLSRLPRVLGALLIGASLALSGALMQGVTRNYLASPSITGVLDGSALLVTIGYIFFSGLSSWGLILFSLIGSALGTAIVFGMASLIPNGFSPARLGIIGLIIGTFFSSLSSIIATYFQASQDISFWFNARLDQTSLEFLGPTLPFFVLGVVLAFSVAGSVTILALGEEVSISLGQKTIVVKGLAMLSVIVLTGLSVALAGKISFIGLIIPHIVRYLIGVDYRHIVPCSAIFGGVFLAFCDILARLVNFPFETPIGVLTSLFGVPFFLYLVYTRGGKRHV
uniref:Ferrichrome ABC transporter permease n=1 Tax=Thermosporothrix sp. COM3 TaxID=2490863 RepID=A0A455SF32_9CHLR|nr:ferrichrome ABC transporter permease [Thermosporothrix sp. COM3]